MSLSLRPPVLYDSTTVAVLQKEFNRFISRVGFVFFFLATRANERKIGGSRKSYRELRKSHRIAVVHFTYL